MKGGAPSADRCEVEGTGARTSVGVTYEPVRRDLDRERSQSLRTGSFVLCRGESAESRVLEDDEVMTTTTIVDVVWLLT